MRLLQTKHSPKCPCCAVVLDGMAAPDDCPRTEPKPNDISMCAHCRTFLRFNADLALVELTPEEIVNLPAHIRAQLIHAREKLRQSAR